jgi:hypothetical protein
VSSYVPLGESKIHLASALGNDSLLLLQAAADNAGGDGQVAVVAIGERPMLASRCSGTVARRQAINSAVSGSSIDVRKTSGSPRGRHFGGVGG